MPVAPNCCIQPILQDPVGFCLREIKWASSHVEMNSLTMQQIIKSSFQRGAKTTPCDRILSRVVHKISLDFTEWKMKNTNEKNRSSRRGDVATPMERRRRRRCKNELASRVSYILQYRRQVVFVDLDQDTPVDVEDAGDASLADPSLPLHLPSNLFHSISSFYWLLFFPNLGESQLNPGRQLVQHVEESQKESNGIVQSLQTNPNLRFNKVQVTFNRTDRKQSVNETIQLQLNDFGWKRNGGEDHVDWLMDGLSRDGPSRDVRRLITQRRALLN